MNVPVKFKIKEIPPYDLVEGDTVYNTFDKPLAFTGGGEAMTEFLTANLKYPEGGNDSCSIGTIYIFGHLPDQRSRVMPHNCSMENTNVLRVENR